MTARGEEALERIGYLLELQLAQQKDLANQAAALIRIMEQLRDTLNGLEMSLRRGL